MSYSLSKSAVRPCVRPSVRPSVRHICSLCYSVIRFSLKAFILQLHGRRGGADGWNVAYEARTGGFESLITLSVFLFFLLLERIISDFQARIGRQEGFRTN